MNRALCTVGIACSLSFLPREVGAANQCDILEDLSYYTGQYSFYNCKVEISIQRLGKECIDSCDVRGSIFIRDVRSGGAALIPLYGEKCASERSVPREFRISRLRSGFDWKLRERLDVWIDPKSRILRIAGSVQGNTGQISQYHFTICSGTFPTRRNGGYNR